MTAPTTNPCATCLCVTCTNEQCPAKCKSANGCLSPVTKCDDHRAPVYRLEDPKQTPEYLIALARLRAKYPCMAKDGVPVQLCECCGARPTYADICDECGGYRCPHCQGGKADIGHAAPEHNADRSTVTVRALCLHCGYSWTDTYTLDGQSDPQKVAG